MASAWWTLAAVATGGACGAVGRYAIAEAVRAATTWPSWVGTFLANGIGCFAIGVVWSWTEAQEHEPWVRALLVTGLLGAFTTFSTFSLDAMHLIHDRAWGTLAGYVGASVVLGILAVSAGLWLHGRF